MRIFTLLLALLFLGCTGEQAQNVNCPQWLQGKWVSDWETTEAHFRDDCNLSVEQIEMLGSIMGKMEISYSNEAIEVHMPAHVLRGPDGDVEIEESRQVKRSKYLWANDKMVAIVDPKDEEYPEIFPEQVQLINRSGADSYWIYLGHAAALDINAREYFKRAKQ